MQWTPQNPTSSVNVLYPPLISPNHHYPGGATYSFTADFRPPTSATQPIGSMVDSMKISPASPPYYQNTATYSPPQSPMMTYDQVCYPKNRDVFQ